MDYTGAAITRCRLARMPGAEFVELFAIHAGDGVEFGQSAGLYENDAAQGGGAEDEELREAQLFGFGFAPFAETVIELAGSG